MVLFHHGHLQHQPCTLDKRECSACSQSIRHAAVAMGDKSVCHDDAVYHKGDIHGMIDILQCDLLIYHVWSCSSAELMCCFAEQR